MAALPDRPPQRDRAELVSHQVRGLPAWRTQLIGRDGDLARLLALLRGDDARLVTVTGPGGAGKTRLAVAAATDLAAEYADGGVFVPLAPVRDPALVPAAIAQAMELPDTGRLHAALRDRRMLLVLDNLEHVLDAADMVAQMADACPRLRILVTSRIRLNLAGEVAYPLPSMEPVAARALFETRARALNPAFTITDASGPVVDAICERLDWLPLAIELAAARTPVLSPQALLARLPHPLDVLAHGPRDAPERQRSMRDTIAWSHDLLGERERVVLRRLAVFAGGFTLEAADAVAGVDGDVLNALAGLVDSSLVRPAGGADDLARLTMLETIREYALERLVASGEETEIRDRHAAYYLTDAEALWTSMISQKVTEIELRLRRLYPERDNLRGALAWLLDHDPVTGSRLAYALDEYWFRFGHFAEGRVWLARALDHGDDIPPDVSARLLVSDGWLAYQQGALAQAETQLARATASLRQGGEAIVLHWALSYSGNIALSLGKLEHAGQLFDETLTLAIQFDEPALVALATLDLGRVLAASGDLARAEAMLADALSLTRRQPESYLVGFSLYFLGNVVLARENIPRALACFREALERMAAARDWTNVARCAEGIARAVAADRPGDAVRIFGAAARVREELGHPVDREDLPAHERALEVARRRLSGPEYEAEWSAGQAMTWPDVAAQATVVATAFIEGADAGRRSRQVLSGREREVLALLVAGKTDGEIAEALSIDRRTAATHVSHIYDKLGVSSRAEAAAEAVRRGLA